jgi:hypothetical protein
LREAIRHRRKTTARAPKPWTLWRCIPANAPINGAKKLQLLKARSIEFSRGAIDCIVRNMSDVGAALEVESVVGVPSAFNLFVKDTKQQRACRAVWRSRRTDERSTGCRAPLN